MPFVKPCKKLATNSTLTNCGPKDLQHAKEKQAKQTSVQTHQMPARCKTANIQTFSILNWVLANICLLLMLTFIPLKSTPDQTLHNDYMFKGNAKVIVYLFYTIHKPLWNKLWLHHHCAVQWLVERQEG